MFSKWTFFQLLVLGGLGGLAYGAEQFSSSIAIPTVSPSAQLVLIISFTLISVGLTSLLFFFQTKKSKLFLRHPLWEKMHILVIGLLIVSFIALFIGINGLSDLIMDHRWLFYILIYYVIYLFNLLILVFVHKFSRPQMTAEKKVAAAFWWTCFAAVALQFVISG